MPETGETRRVDASGDVVLQEIWRAKDTLSAAYGHDLRRLLAEARDRQERSGHPVVDLSRKAGTSGR